jgi:hypothetical protein
MVYHCSGEASGDKCKCFLSDWTDQVDLLYIPDLISIYLAYTLYYTGFNICIYIHTYVEYLLEVACPVHKGETKQQGPKGSGCTHNIK